MYAARDPMFVPDRRILRGPARPHSRGFTRLMLTQALAIARNTFVESLRQPVVIMILLLSGVLQWFNTMNTGFAMGLEESGELEGDNKLLLDVGLATVFVCGAILAAFLATAALSREIENKTVLTVVSKPVSRHVVVLGKYLGMAGAILIPVAGMLVFLLMAIRHGVMSTAADDPDQPLILFSVASVFSALLLAAWCNYFYGWSFPQMATLLVVPFAIVAYVGVLFVSKKWEIQPPTKDFKPQVTLACVSLTMAVLVLTAVALAASARLGQVMTVFICLGVFVASLLTNHFIGRYAFVNQAIGEITTATPLDTTHQAFIRPGDTYTLQLRRPPNQPIAVPSPIYYGPNANGFDLAVPTYEPFTGNPTDSVALLGADTPSALVIVEAADNTLRIRNIGAQALPVRRPPAAEDFVFLGPTVVNPLALAVWAAFPNMHYFWLLDAVSQNQPIPAGHIGLVALYGSTQIVALLALAVILFQRRDVG